MKAAVLTTPGQPLTLMDDIEIPELKRGQVLVKILYTSVCHSQLMEASGKRGDDPWLPHLLGHEATAAVVATGEDVSKVKEGQLVILTWIKGDGLEVGSTQYRHGDTVINSGAVTTFNEYSVVSENRCVALPEDIPLDVGSLFGCAVMTGAGIVTNSLNPEAGSSLAVFGAGGVGLSAIMAAKLHQCDPLIVVDIEPEKLQLASDFGATHVIDASQTDPVKAIHDLTGGRGVDYSVEAAGMTTTIEQAFESVRRGGGRCIFAGHPEAGGKIRLDPFELICGKHIEGSWGGDSRPDVDIPRFAKLYREGALPLDQLITYRYRLDNINQALDDMRSHKVGRALIKVSDP